MKPWGPARVLPLPETRGPKPRRTDPLERVNREAGRRSSGVGDFPPVVRLGGVLLIEKKESISWSAATCPRRESLALVSKTRGKERRDAFANYKAPDETRRD